MANATTATFAARPTRQASEELAAAAQDAAVIVDLAPVRFRDAADSKLLHNILIFRIVNRSEGDEVGQLLLRELLDNHFCCELTLDNSSNLSPGNCPSLTPSTKAGSPPPTMARASRPASSPLSRECDTLREEDKLLNACIPK